MRREPPRSAGPYSSDHRNIGSSPNQEDAVDLIAQGWLEEEHRFEKILARMELEEV